MTLYSSMVFVKALSFSLIYQDFDEEEFCDRMPAVGIALGLS
jgi:hypothetical protein